MHVYIGIYTCSLLVLFLWGMLTNINIKWILTGMSYTQKFIYK